MSKLTFILTLKPGDYLPDWRFCKYKWVEFLYKYSSL